MQFSIEVEMLLIKQNIEQLTNGMIMPRYYQRPITQL